MILYNIPSRCVIDMPERPARRAGARSTNVAAVKQANPDNLAPIEGLDLLAGNDDMLADVLDMGGAGGILVGSHLVGEEMRRMIDEPDRRREIADEIQPLLEPLTAPGVTTNPIPIKTALEMLGHDVGRVPAAAGRGLRGGAGRHPRRARAPRPPERGLSGATLRVLPLGGLGEIGKNMTVVEYDGRIVVVDTGLMFPTPDQLGIDLVLPDFTYLRERAEDIEAIVLTHGHEDHVGALPFVLREIGDSHVPPIYGGPLTDRDGALEARRAQAEGHAARGGRPRRGRRGRARSRIELVKMSHSIPDAFAVALECELGTTLITGDYKFDQTPVDGIPADVSRLAELGREGLLLLCGDSTNADRPGHVAVRVERRAGARAAPSRAATGGSSSPASPRTSTASSRWWTPPPSSGRKVVPRGPLDAQEREHRQRARPHRDPGRACWSGVGEIEDFPDHKLVVISTGSQGEPLSALRRMAHGDHPNVKLHEGDTVVFSATPDPRQRARRERDDRPHLPPRRRRDHHAATRRSTPRATASPRS